MGESKKRRKVESESSSATAQGRRDWTELPDDVTAWIIVLSNPKAIDILKEYQMVCKTWRRVCCNYSILWRTIDIDFRHKKGKLDSVLKMCRRAVDRSSGTLVDLTLQNFRTGTDELLKYITSSCRGIKRLTLANCVKITDEGLREVASKLPLLEDLGISHGSVSQKTVEVIGKSCPLLKSLRWNKKIEIDTKRLDDDCAKAIAAGMMHGLQHLQLSGIHLSNDALDEILNYSPHLESLHLSNISIWTLDGRRDTFREDLKRKLTEHVKNVRPPPTDLYCRYRD
ncbi:putative F-box/LRR-repeat protein 23 [Rosa sericea]